jgi:hypothetical protein
MSAFLPHISVMPEETLVISFLIAQNGSDRTQNRDSVRSQAFVEAFLDTTPTRLTLKACCPGWDS